MTANNSKMCAPKSSKAATTVVSSRWLYFAAVLPLPLLLFLYSQLLRSTIAPPPSDHGTGSMFDLIATRYDFINRALALNLDMGWRHRLVSEVVGPNGELFSNNNHDVKLLDLATGTADVAILLGKAAAKYSSEAASTTINSAVLGLDPSQNMLNVGKTKVKESDLANIVTLELGDARELTALQDDTFDAATMSFGIRNVPEKEQALCEINRVLKKGGDTQTKLAIMEFSEPGEDSGVMGSMARAFIRHVIPSMGALLSGAPREYMHLQKSIQEFPSPPEFVKLIEGVMCPIKSVDEEGEVQINTFGSFRVKEVVNLNFGSVQIYVATPYLKTHVTE